MGQISLQIPQSGFQNSTEDPKIASDLTIIQTLVNGNLDSSNISAVSGYMRLATRTVGASVTANAGDLVVFTGSSAVTLTLPAPAAQAVVGVINLSSGGATVSGTSIYGAGLSAATSFKLGTVGAAAILQSDGSSWYLVAGQQDTGWVALSLAGGIGAAAGFTPASRQVGNTVRMRGTVVNQSGGTQVPGTGLAGSFPTPSSTVSFPCAIASPFTTVIITATAVQIGVTWANGATANLDSVIYDRT